MKLTKDEATILWECLHEHKYELVTDLNHNERKDTFKALEALEVRLQNMAQDRRRIGRSSRNDFSDVLRRYTQRNKQQGKEADDDHN